MNGSPGPRPRTLRSLAALLGLGLACLLVAASPASAAKRHMPFGFLGRRRDPAMAYGESPATLDAQYALMARRISDPDELQLGGRRTRPGRRTTGRPPDAIMVAAGRARARRPAIVEFTPYWASSQPGNHGTLQPPADYSTFGTFMTAAIERYGPNGTFWKATRSSRPTRSATGRSGTNRPATSTGSPRRGPASYVKLLKAGYKAIKKADQAREGRLRRRRRAERDDADAVEGAQRPVPARRAEVHGRRRANAFRPAQQPVGEGRSRSQPGALPARAQGHVQRHGDARSRSTTPRSRGRPRSGRSRRSTSPASRRPRRARRSG